MIELVASFLFLSLFNDKMRAMKKAIKKQIEEHQLDLQTAIVFHKAERTIRSLENQSFQDADITATQFAVLETLYSKGPLRIQDLLNRMLATSGNMTVVIKNMVRDDYITKTCDPNDRRAYLISLTEKGIKKIESCLPNHIQQVTQILSVLEDQDKEDLIRILKKFSKMS